jgi:hypothetical protein
MTPALAMPRRWFLIAAGVCLVAVAFAWNALDAVPGRLVSVEEGAHLVAARSAMAGRLPYADFAYMPSAFFPYVVGPALAATRYGAFELRCVNVAFAALGLAAACLAFGLRARRAEVGLVAAFSVAASPHWVNAVVAGGPIAAATLWVGLACAAFLSGRALLPRAILFVVASSLAVGCAPISAFGLVPLAVCLSLEAPSPLRRAALSAVTIVVPWIGLAAMFLSTSPDAAADLWRVHFAGETEQNWRYSLMKMFSVSPGAALALIPGLAAVPALVAHRAYREIACLAAAIAGIGMAFFPLEEASVSAAPVFPLVAGAGFMAAWAAVRGSGSPLRHVAWLAPLMGLYVPVFGNPGDLADDEIAEVAGFIESEVPRGPILTPFPAVAIAAARPVIAGTDLGANAVLPAGRDRQALRLHLTTQALLARAVEARRPRAVVLHRTDETIDFALDRERRKRLPSSSMLRFQRAVAERYERALQTDNLAVYVPRAQKEKRDDVPK